MSEKLVATSLLIIFVLASFLVIRQELKNIEQEQRDAVILEEISALKKQTRINAQDVDFLEKLIIEGK